MVELEPELDDFAVDEDEPEPPDAEPPPPPRAKVKVVAKPKPRAKPKPPKRKVVGGADESTNEKTIEVGAAGTQTANGTGASKPRAAKPKAAKPKPKPEAKPTPKAKPKIDPTKPIDRPENATAPKALPSNKLPVYPNALRDKGVTGSVLIKLHVHRDGSVRGAKVLRKKNNAASEEERTAADKLFLKAVIAAIKTWKYTPAKLNGQPITVWHKVTIPFSLTSTN